MDSIGIHSVSGRRLMLTAFPPKMRGRRWRAVIACVSVSLCNKPTIAASVLSDGEIRCVKEWLRRTDKF